MTIDGLLRSHAAEPDQKPLVCYPYQGVSDFEEHSAKDIERYTNLAVQFYVRHGLEPAVGAFDPSLQSFGMTLTGICRIRPWKRRLSSLYSLRQDLTR